ncbi:hypothetical protein VIGAN_04296300 [Vigna angularis var. angularis]|uniref:Uncharacterized protein n=1 Tax=Vigna angularis var. angularis TaxID=157739 RepID=A0A0S3RXT3_PHAAN|nr:hypothetical protein VIGAN_04296300 [Vigna angularis var. angularis]
MSWGFVIKVMLVLMPVWLMSTIYNFSSKGIFSERKKEKTHHKSHFSPVIWLGSFHAELKLLHLINFLYDFIAAVLSVTKLLLLEPDIV